MAAYLTVRPGRRSVLRLSAAALAVLALPRGAARAAGAPVKIGIIGSGHIGGTIGSLWVKAGHEVLFSSRHPEELKGLVDGLGPKAQAGTTAQAAAFGEAAFIAVPYKAMPDLGHELAAALAGKLLLDATNAVAGRDGAIAAEVAQKGIGLATAEYFPGAHVVRAFNTMSYKIFASEAHRTGEPVGIPIAGDDAAAVALAEQLIRDAGFEPVMIGPLARAKDFALGTPLAGEHTPTQLHQLMASQH